VAASTFCLFVCSHLDGRCQISAAHTHTQITMTERVILYKVFSAANPTMVLRFYSAITHNTHGTRYILYISHLIYIIIIIIFFLLLFSFFLVVVVIVVVVVIIDSQTTK
jgi:hypothetical protein